MSRRALGAVGTLDAIYAQPPCGPSTTRSAPTAYHTSESTGTPIASIWTVEEVRAEPNGEGQRAVELRWAV